MKKTYQAPQMKEFMLQMGHQLLVSSSITPSGSSNTLLFSDDYAEEEEEARVKSNNLDWDW
ncbi:MAG: hypothetical protein IKR98_06220 [Bacteroidaceae bacterium]|nr:hypothetical protein [Bacteroidaceae bacterium]